MPSRPRVPAYESLLRLGMLALGTVPVVLFTVVTLILLSSTVASDVTARTATQLTAARAMLDQGREQLAGLAESYAGWQPLLDRLARADLAGVKSDVLD